MLLEIGKDRQIFSRPEANDIVVLFDHGSKSCHREFHLDQDDQLLTALAEAHLQ